MKKNVTLISILAALLLWAYFWDEGQKHLNKHQLDSILEKINYESLQQVKLQKAHLIKKTNKWYLIDETQVVDEKILREYLTHINQLKVDKILKIEDFGQKEKNEVFKNEDLFITLFFRNKNEKLDTLKINLGKKVEYSENFYLLFSYKNEEGKDTELFVIGKDEANQTYYVKSEEVNNSDFKYQKIKNLFSWKDQDFLDLKFFSSDFNFKNILIDNINNLSYTIDFESMESIPESYEPLQYNTQNMLKLKEEMLNLRCEKLNISDGQRKLTRPLFKVSINFRQKRLEFYNSFDGNDGPYMFEVDSGLTYQCFNKLKYLKMNVQDFWIKNPLSSTEKKLNQQIEAELKFKDGELFFSVIAGDTFIIESRDKSIDNELINQNEIVKLFSFLMGVPPFKQAFRVSYLTGDMAQDRKEDYTFDMKINDLEFEFYYNQIELIVRNKISGLSFHYLVGNDVPFGLSLDKYKFSE